MDNLGALGSINYLTSKRSHLYSRSQLSSDSVYLIRNNLQKLTVLSVTYPNSNKVAGSCELFITCAFRIPKVEPNLKSEECAPNITNLAGST